MVDEKIKQKEKKLILMLSKFSDEYLDDEFKALNIKLVQKLARKHDVPFKRGKLENWAGGIVYTIGQLNFLFDDSINPYVTPDEISDYFGCSKSTAANKARDIRKLLNLKLGNPDFSTELVIDCNLSNLGGDLTQVKTLSNAQRHSMFRKVGNMKNSVTDSLEDLINNILENDGNLAEKDVKMLYEQIRNHTFIAPKSSDSSLYISDQFNNNVFPIFTDKTNFDIMFKNKNIKSKKWRFSKLVLLLKDKSLDGLVINPLIKSFF